MSPRKFDRFMVDVHIGASRKLRRLSPAERWCHIAGILPVAAQAPVRGRLLVGQDQATAEDFAETAGVSVSVARSAVEKLRKIGVIVPDDEYRCEQVHDWDDWNPAPKDDRTAPERMRRYRAAVKERNGTTNGTVAQNPATPVTDVSPPPLRSVTRNGGGVTDRNVTERNAVTVTPGREEKGRKDEAKASSRLVPTGPDTNTFEEEDTEVQGLCRLLAEQAKAANPKFKVKSRSRWLSDMRLLRDRDENAPDEIERVVRWLFGDTKDARFWSRQIQSPGNLRDQFSRLWATMLEEERPRLRAVPTVDTDEFLSRVSA